MLQAQLMNGRSVSLLDEHDTGKLQQMRRDQQFYCPACMKKVTLKLGTKRRWHFAHEKKKACTYATEGESDTHVLGKRYLLDWLTRQQLPSTLECFLPEIRQRPDIYVHDAQYKVAIEFQCASMDIAAIHARSYGYKKESILPVWILGGHRLKRKNSSIYRLRSFEWFALRRRENERYLTYYDPTAKMFGFLRHILPVRSSAVLAQIQLIPSDNLSFASLLQPPQIPFTLLNELLRVRQRMRTYPEYRTPRDRFFQQFLTANKRPPGQFPLEAGWPLSSQPFTTIPAMIWQTLFLFRFLLPLPLDHPFSLHQATASLRAILGSFSIPYLPYTSPTFITAKLTEEYLQLLMSFATIKKVGEEHYVCTSEPVLFETTEELSKRDSEYGEIWQKTLTLL
ncbi:competence protein CoiA [Shouchella shacheensis]|uniref:competence protein CoiA n=1 Tax=Shouchella shacheensis TaxID=1649580 RepID=UPI00073FFA27|nr:competence protein CoiA family protein [Shouchella shacheensis]